MNPALIALAIQETPILIDRLRELWHKGNPNEPEPTSAEVIAAYTSAFISSLATDDQWLAAHPKT